MPSEFDLIRRHFTRPTPSAVLGPGDDCALIAPSPGMELAVTTDMLVAGTHFFADTDPGRLGWKALAVNLSDLAAMGAHPRWITLAGSLPAAENDWLAAFASGLFACADAYGVDLIGGDTTRGPLNLCLTAIGEVPAGKALRRDGARAGDDIWVSGRPGLAALGLAHLQGRVDLPQPWQKLCISCLEKPRPRVDLGLALRPLASAAIDISDGLLADLGHIAARSSLFARIELVQLPHLPKGPTPESLPRALALSCQLGGGDDYELLFTAPPAARLALGEVAAMLELPLWCIGEMQVPGEQGMPGGVTIFDPDGKPVDIETRGFDHFAPQQA